MEEHKTQERQKQTVFDLPKVIAIGIASPAAGFLTSGFGVAGTLIGLALSAMILTAVADFLKVYLARTPHVAAHAAHIVTHKAATTKMPTRRRRRGLLTRLFRRRSRANSRSKTPYHGFSGSPAPARRWALLVGRSVLAAGISFVLALGVVTALEHSAGKSLTCWVWQECPAESSSTEEGDEAPEQHSTTTLPSILGGGSSAGNEAAGVRPAADGGVASEQRPAPNDLGAPEPPSSLEAPSEPAGSGGTDSETAGLSSQQQSPSYKRQEEASYYYSSEEYEEPTSNISPSSSGIAEEDQNGAPPDTEGKTRGGGYEVPLVPWTT